MERRPDRFTALIDANALVPVLQRNLILSFAGAGCYRPRWSSKILDEVERTLERIVPSIDAEKARAQRLAIERAFPEGAVDGWEPLKAAFASGRDPNDAHVTAAAMRCGAAVIVTANLKDFAPEFLAPFDMEAVAPDDFLADAIDLDQERAVAVVSAMRNRLKRPELTAETLLTKMDDLGLSQTAALLRPYSASL